MRHRKTLAISFGISLCCHAMALFCVQRYSLWFSSSQSATPSDNWLELVDKKEKDHILKETFDALAKDTGARASCVPAKEEIVASIKSPLSSDPPEVQHLTLFQLTLPPQESLLGHSVLPTFSVPTRSFNLLDHLPKDLAIPKPTPSVLPQLLPLPAKTSLTLLTKPSLAEEAPNLPMLYVNDLDLSLTATPQVSKAPAPIPLPNLPKLPTLAELDTASYSDSFDADLVFLPREDKKGYLFALTLIPRPDLNLPKLTQHFTFLIDRSNSIQQGRLSATVNAVQKALDALSSEDTFNIIAFDGKLDKMSPHYLPCTPKAYTTAETFLHSLQLGSFFSSSDLYKPLFLTVPAVVQPHELHTVILFTDGECLNKKGAAFPLFADWTPYNAGKVSLFIMSMQDPHLSTLDAMSALNRGKLIQTTSYRGMKRKLLKLLKTIQSPIAKNMSCHAISRTPSGKITLLTSQWPHLYLDQPYVILGETDTLDDFILFVQGRLQDRWLNIKKTVSFLNARKGNRSLKQEWAMQQAYLLYQQFVTDLNPQHIVDAKALLEPYDVQAAF